MKWLTCSAVVVLTACATPPPDLPSGPDAYVAIPAPTAQQSVSDYRVGALDRINVTVFQEPDLSLTDVQVDASGNILLPLIGSVTAAGRTTSELSQEIAERLDSRFLVDPQVSVNVSSSVSQKVTVEGSVTEPGVYEIKGRTTLLEALAMAKGPTRVAALDQVVVFRMANGQRMGALFDVKAIRRGEVPDPEILGNDTVVVGLSNLQAAWRDLLTAAPFFNAFAVISSR